ncbi:MAG: alpha-glucosidase [Paracoccaceae bacterium]
MNETWWKGAVVYQIYPRSFQDDSGDGVGDLAGITRRLGHVADLGADAIWLSPVFTSPMKDMGYDVSDYCDIDPTFGTLADFDALVARAHALGLKVIIDQVISHSSNEHPLFVESRASRDTPKADWYVWADSKPDGSPPNNWQSIFGGSAWQWDTGRKQYYLHNFLKEQPDFNFHNRDVQDHMLDVFRFWLDRGVDGFRLDTVNFYFHDARLRDQAPVDEPFYSNAFRPYDMQRQIFSKNRPENLAFLERLRALTDSYDAHTMVGEVGETVDSLSIMEAYTRGANRLHMAYSFDMLSPEFSAAHFRSRIEGFFNGAPDGWPSWSFSNHDVMRHVSRWTPHAVDQDSMARLAIGMLASFEGTIGIYNGEELGQTDTDLAYHELTDVQGLEFWPKDKGRDGCRTPIVWDADAPNAGFSDATPWLPVKDPQAARAVSRQVVQNDSVLNTYKEVLAYRRAQAVLRVGRSRFVDLPEPVLAFHREADGARLTCVFNLSPEPLSVHVSGMVAMDGPSQAATLSEGQLDLGGNGFAYLRSTGDAPDLSML